MNIILMIFKTILSGILSVKQFGSTLSPADILSVLIYVQTVCKGYQNGAEHVICDVIASTLWPRLCIGYSMFVLVMEFHNQHKTLYNLFSPDPSVSCVCDNRK